MARADSGAEEFAPSAAHGVGSRTEGNRIRRDAANRGSAAAARGFESHAAHHRWRVQLHGAPNGTAALFLVAGGAGVWAGKLCGYFGAADQFLRRGAGG